MMSTHRNNKGPKEVKGQEAHLQLNNIIKSLRTCKETNGSETGSTNGGGSDTSALVSLGNTSFGFNFDSDERMSNDSKEGQTDSNEDSDANGGNPSGETSKVPAGQSGNASRKKKKAKTTKDHGKRETNSGGSGSDEQKSSISSLTNSDKNDEQKGAAAKAVAGLESIARTAYPAEKDGGQVAIPPGQRKRKNEKETDSEGYNTDDDENNKSTKSEKGDANHTKSRKKKRGDIHKREERNQREKERSFRIAKQISDLRNLLSSGGVVIPKGTKSSVLTEAANYIRTLQQHQYRSEIDRFQLVQQMQLIGSGAQGPQAAAAVRHVAAQNGVWSLGNFGGVPPKSAMAFYQPNLASSAQQDQQPAQQDEGANGMFLQTKVEPADYRFIFNSSGVGMAIASMGGSFIDCNQLFCQLSSYTKQEVCSLTIFNLTARQDLQQAFDKISLLISPPTSGNLDEDPCKVIIIRGAMKNRNDLGMSVAVVKGEDGIAKCFCVTLVKNPTSPFDTSRPVPVSFDAIHNVGSPASVTCKDSNIETAPAFTSG